MRKISLRRPSPALVIACVALGIALGGTSVAAVSQLGRNTVGTAQLRSGAVTNPKLRNNSVTSAKVVNRSLRRADFAPGQLPAGPTGPAGPAGPAGPPGLSAVERVDFTSPSNSQPLKSFSMTCPTGKRLLGGGARLNPSLVGVGIAQSYPDDDNVYRVTAREFVPHPNSWSVTVFAVCAVAS